VYEKKEQKKEHKYLKPKKLQPRVGV